MRRLGLVLLGLPVLIACGGPEAALPLRSDIGTEGLQNGVVYNLQGPAGSDQQENFAVLRGVNGNSPERGLRTEFGQMSGTKTQDVTVSLPDGKNVQALGMSKIARGVGFSRYMTVEGATYWAADAKGKILCQAKIRLDFNRNLAQIFDAKKTDFDSLWYYDVPCQKSETGQMGFDIPHAKLRALVLNEVWQFRIGWGRSSFFNMGHSVTSIGGPAANLPGGWWGFIDIPGSSNDSQGAAEVVRDMVKDLQSSPQRWLEYTPGGKFDRGGAYLIYSAGDADQYLTLNRIFLNRQNSYAVAYRPDRETPWSYIRIDPRYNYEWNDAGQLWAKAKSYGSAPFNDRVDQNGLPKDINDPVISELERIGWMNAPNASLDQVAFISPGGQNGHINYAVTVRAYVGANDTLVLFAPLQPNLEAVRKSAPEQVKQQRPILRDDSGKVLPDEKQWTESDWSNFQRESTIWNWLQDNPRHINADLALQYRFRDNSTWRPEYCDDSNGNSHVCGYSPVNWNLSASYYTNGDVMKPWLVLQLLGEVGMRTLGFSYVSGRYLGTGVDFALAQQVFQQKYYQGFRSPEDAFIFDARALQLPDTLKEAWTALKAA